MASHQWTQFGQTAFGAIATVAVATPHSSFPHLAQFGPLRRPSAAPSTVGFNANTSAAALAASNTARVVGAPVSQENSLFANFHTSSRRTLSVRGLFTSAAAAGAPSTTNSANNNSLNAFDQTVDPLTSIFEPLSSSAAASSHSPISTPLLTSASSNSTRTPFNALSLDGTPRRAFSTRSSVHASTTSQHDDLYTDDGSVPHTESLFNHLSARQDGAHSEEIEHDSDNTLNEDMKLLNNDADDIPASAASRIAASIVPSGGFRATPSSSAAARRRSPSPVAVRRAPTILQALEMPPEQLVRGLTMTEEETDAAYALARDAATAAALNDPHSISGGQDQYNLEEDDAEESEGEAQRPLMNELVEWLAQSNQASRKEKHKLADLPHTLQEFFVDGGRVQDLGNFNTLIRVCAAKNMYEEGWKHFEYMKQMGLVPDAKTYVALVDLCCVQAEGSAVEAKAVNAQRLARVYELLEEYKRAYSGRVEEAFFNVMTKAVGKQSDDIDQAFQVVELMKKQHVMPSQIIYTELINICRKKRSQSMDPVVRQNCLMRAEKTFNYMKKHGGNIEPDSQTYNVMIRTAGEAGNAEVAIALFNEMREKQYAPDPFTYGALIHACSKSPEFYPQTFEYFTDFLAQGFKPSVRIYNVLLNACARNSDVANAMQLWDLMSKAHLVKDVVTYNTMFNTIANSMKVDEVRRLSTMRGDSRSMKELAAEEKYTKEQRIDMSYALFNQMKQENIAVNLRTLNSVVKVFAVGGRLNRVLHFQESMFNLYPQFQKDFHSYKMIFSMYVDNNRPKLALNHVELMHEAGFKATKNMYTSLLRKLAKPQKKMKVEQLEELGQQVLRNMKVDGVPIKPEDERLFHPEMYKAHMKETAQERLQRDTLKSGVLYTYTQREDAMLRPDRNRTGVGRQGHQETRFAEQPHLAVYKQKRQQRAADKKDRMQGIKPQQRRAQQEAVGHYYDNSRPASAAKPNY